MGMAYGIGGLIKVPPQAIRGNGAPSAALKAVLGAMYFDESDPLNPVMYIYNGVDWLEGGTSLATTTTPGSVVIDTVITGADTDATVATSKAVFDIVQGVVVGAVPAATELNAGIAEIATQVETDAGTDDTRIVTPLKLANFIGAGGVAGSFTDLTATGAVNFTGATGAITMTSGTASNFDVSGAGIDLTLASAAGRVVINGEEAAADAVRIVSAAGGLDVDTALLLSLTSSRNNAQAILIESTAGGIDITAAGAAGEDIDIVNTAGSVNITAGESGTDAIVISATIGGVQINAPGAAAGEDIALTATGSSIRLVSTENVSDAIVLSASNGGIQILAPSAAAGEDIELTATGSSVRLTSTENVTDAINIEATLGGINILASGASAGEDINLTATGSSINLASTENAALAITLNTNGGTSETIRVRNQQGTSAASVDIQSTAGGLTFTSGLASADAINLVASDAAGGIDIDAGTAGIIADTTGGVSLDSAAASNFTVTGAFDLSLISTAGSVNVTAGEDAADAIVLSAGAGGIDILATGAAGQDIDIVNTGGSLNLQATESDVNAITINASGVAGGVNMDAGTSGVIVDTTGAISLDSAAASNFTVTGAFDLTVQSTAGSVIVSASESANDALQLLSTAGGIDILASGAAAGEDIDIIATGSSVNISSTESAADSITIVSTAGGIDILASGAAAGEDIDIVATGSSINITATENVTDAILITASGAASRIVLDAGTGSFQIGTGLVVPVTTVNNAASPYTVLGTDYFLSVDTSGGAVTVTLPAATALAGRTFVIRDTGGAAGANNITIGGGGTNLVGGGAAAATKVLAANYAGATVYSNGTTWNYAYVA